MRLDVNTDAVVKFTNKLEKISRSALPVSIRSALNSAAFDMKKTSIQRSAEDNFTIRKKNFFKANSRVEMAKGFDINTMQSAVGFTGDDQAIEDLEQQERGGKIDGRSFIPMAPARSSNSPDRLVRPNARISRIKVVKASSAPGKNDQEKFVRSVIFAGVGGHVLAAYKGKMILWKVNSLKRTDEGSFKLTPVYSYEKGRSVKVDPTNFMHEAVETTVPKIEQFYINAAEKQLQKYTK